MRLFVLLLSICAACVSAAGTTIIRVRTVDGSVLRVPLPDDGSSSTISSILNTAGIDLNAADSDGKGSLKCQVGPPGRQTDVLDLSPNGKDRDTTAEELGLKHGSMITILPPPMPKKKEAQATNTVEEDENNNRFDPFPDLAKSISFSAANRRARALSRGVSRGMTYGDISRVR
eukprot:scaffold14954_cov133-Skeletonema_marinoi.AAC.1